MNKNLEATVSREKENKPGYKKTKLGWIPEDWEIKTVNQIAKVIMGQSPNGDTYNYSGIGKPLINGPTEFTDKHPIRKQWTSAPTKMCRTEDILLCVRGSSTGRINIADDSYCIGRGVAAIRANTDLNQKFVEIQLKNGVHKILKLTSGSTFPNIDSKSLRSIKFIVPSAFEQTGISECITQWENSIELINKLIKQKKLFKKGLMQQLLTGKKRLPGFSGEWKEFKLEKFFRERNEKGFDNLPLLSVGEAGVYPQSDSNKKDTSNKDKSKYKRICPGDIGYNTMRLWQGRNALSHLEGIISPAYTVVIPKENAHAEFFKYLFKLPEVVHKFYRNSQGLVSDTLNCKFKDFKIVKVMLPPTLDEQIAIADILIFSDKEIELLKQKKELLQNQKKGLMQQLLTGKKRLKV